MILADELRHFERPPRKCCMSGIGRKNCSKSGSPIVSRDEDEILTVSGRVRRRMSSSESVVDKTDISGIFMLGIK